MSDASNPNQRLEIVKKLRALHRPQRLAYFWTIVACILVLLTSGVVSLVTSEVTYVSAIGMFGSSGGIVTLAGLLVSTANKESEWVMRGKS